MADNLVPRESAQTATAEKSPEAKGAELAEATRPAAKASGPAQGKPAGDQSAAKAGESPDAPAAVHQEPGVFNAWLHDFLRESPSWLTSMVVHMIMLLVFALLVYEDKPQDTARQLVVAPGDSDKIEDVEELEDQPLDDVKDTQTDVAASVVSNIQQETPVVSPADDLDAAPVRVDLSEFGLDRAPRSDLLATVGAYGGTGLSGRGSGARGRLLAAGGGNAGSEKAVAAALRWLANHQMADGGWSFNHTTAPTCRGQCSTPGSLANARCAATAMALLPFLGAGQTHQAGKYKNTVRGGLYFLVNNMKLSPQGGALNHDGGRMYGHGLCSIVLCEAYAMTHDKGLYKPAQAAVNFICYAQDPVGGGWRYSPRERGDTSVVGWQIMALKSGHMAYLQVPPSVIKKAFLYLDGVQSNSGANYGYTDPGAGQATTAIGLLCRMYLGWKKDNPALQRGVEWIGKIGPSVGRGWNMYYNYYATQVMRHWEGEEWKKWNAVMRDALVNSQCTKGHEEGSWLVPGHDHGVASGGRLYCTTLATMILEVYYRHMPIYRTQSVEEDFPEG